MSRPAADFGDFYALIFPRASGILLSNKREGVIGMFEKRYKALSAAGIAIFYSVFVCLAVTIR